MLNITAPFREKKEVLPLIGAGADELYCGYLPKIWSDRYTSLEFERKGGGSNFTDIDELREAVGLAHSKNVPVFLTLNGLYVWQQYPVLLKIVDEVNKIDFDGFIVADIGLLLTLRKMGIDKELHISTGGTVFNSEAVRFYKGLGVSRIILDRQVSVVQMKELAEDNPSLDFEVFILNTLCVYIDGFCTFLHTYGRDVNDDISRKEWKEDERLYLSSAYDPLAQSDACCLKWSTKTYGVDGNGVDLKDVLPAFYKHLSDGVECGACALYDIDKTKVKSVKIVGRQTSSDNRLISVKFIRRAINLIRENRNMSIDNFIKKVQKLYCKDWKYKKKCQGNNCYHPYLIDGQVTGCR